MAGAWQQSQEGAPTTKEMTRQHKDCSTIFSTKFIKNCFMYSCVKHTGILHTGSNQHNEPVNHMPKIGWASCILPTKLGGVNPRPMGTANCGWLPPGVDRGPNTGQSASSNEMFTRRQESGRLRGSGTLVQRGNCRDTNLPKELCVPDFPSGKEGWGPETSHKPEGSQPLCEDRALQDGGSSLAPRSPAVTGLDGKDGLEGCLPSSAHPPRLSTPPHISVGKENLQVSMPTFWPVSSTQGVYKATEASSGLPETDRLSSDHLPGRPTDNASGQSSVGANYSADLSTVREPGANCESNEIHTDPNSGVGIPGFSIVLNDNEIITTLQETSKNSTGCQMDVAPKVHLSDGDCMICGKDNCHHEGHPTSSFALLSSPDANELCPSPELQSGGNCDQVQHNALAKPSQQRRPGVVVNSYNSSNGSTSVSTRPIDNSAFRCIQSGLGSSAGWSIPHRGGMVSRGGNSTHKLSGVAGSLPGNQGFREDMAEYHSLTASGQCYSSELHKPERGHSVKSFVPTSDNDLDLVCRAKHYSSSRAPSRPTEFPGRPSV